MLRASPAVSLIALVTIAAATPPQPRQRAAAPLPRTADGHPDLQGVWLNDTATPLERPKAFAEKAYFTPAEAREYEARYLLDRAAATVAGDSFELEVASDNDAFEPGKVLPSMRTSLVTDPPDGIVPSLTSDGQRRVRERTDRIRTHYADNPENFPNSDRCLNVGTATGPPMLPVFYNNNVQIVQTRDYMLVHTEMIHDARVIPLTRTTHLPRQVRLWTGDAVGRWDGDTLVVDTTNFTDKTAFRGTGSGLHVVERFSLSDPDTLGYSFTVDDSETFVRAWSATSAMTRTSARVFEYACHEANYSMLNALRGARFAEQHPPKQD